jgi:hypothetical protein
MAVIKNNKMKRPDNLVEEFKFGLEEACTDCKFTSWCSSNKEGIKKCIIHQDPAKARKKPNHDTHNWLIDVGRHWLMSSRGCSVVTSEATTSIAEQPDAIGWRYGHSILLEAKTSRTDYKKDLQKRFRIYPEKGIGYLRYYITPVGLLKPEELLPGWGLLEVNEKNKVKEVKKSNSFKDYNLSSENVLLLSCLRRLGVFEDTAKCCSIKIYTHQTKNNMTLDILDNFLRKDTK